MQISRIMLHYQTLLNNNYGPLHSFSCQESHSSSSPRATQLPPVAAKGLPSLWTDFRPAKVSSKHYLRSSKREHFRFLKELKAKPLYFIFHLAQVFSSYSRKTAICLPTFTFTFYVINRIQVLFKMVMCQGENKQTTFLSLFQLKMNTCRRGAEYAIPKCASLA